ncbi:Golgin candidate 1 [Zea mays]|uniref:Golgin candidate 1 n=1 Tax=Zea mays TaxID=4577 RepID=A0A1D6NCP7_MAIZE|nr:Golgin candidate 1 [Zea mays]
MAAGSRRDRLVGVGAVSGSRSGGVEHVELEKRYRELTDLLVEAERSKATRRSASSWEEDTDIKALEPLPLHHRHMATANHQVFVHLFLMHLLHRLQDFASREGTSAMGDLAHANLP